MRRTGTHLCAAQRSLNWRKERLHVSLNSEGKVVGVMLFSVGEQVKPLEV